MNPSASAPASTAAHASAWFVMPQILTLVISALVSPGSSRLRLDSMSRIIPERELAHLGSDIVRSHERLAHEHRMGACFHHAQDIGSGEDPALADGGVGPRDPRQEVEGRLERRLEGMEIAVVDADQGRAQRHGALELFRRVYLHERGE